jgi:hypothetical protein
MEARRRSALLSCRAKRDTPIDNVKAVKQVPIDFNSVPGVTAEMQAT